MSTPKPEPANGGVLGLLGGTFDPVHRGHLALCRAALAAGGVAAVRWIPAGDPPHRAGPRASGEHRLRMVELAVAGLANCAVDDSEIRAAAQGRRSYTVDTLERLRGELGPARPLAWILGADAFLGLPSWHRWQALPGLCHLLVAERPGSTLSAADLPTPLRAWWSARRAEHPGALAGAPGGLIYHFPLAPHPASATEVRRRLADADASARLDPLLPPAVLDYIQQHHLYR